MTTYLRYNVCINSSGFILGEQLDSEVQKSKLGECINSPIIRGITSEK